METENRKLETGNEGLELRPMTDHGRRRSRLTTEDQPIGKYECYFVTRSWSCTYQTPRANSPPYTIASDRSAGEPIPETQAEPSRCRTDNCTYSYCMNHLEYLFHFLLQPISDQTMAMCFCSNAKGMRLGGLSGLLGRVLGESQVGL